MTAKSARLHKTAPPIAKYRTTRDGVSRLAILGVGPVHTDAPGTTDTDYHHCRSRRKISHAFAPSFLLLC